MDVLNLVAVAFALEFSCSDRSLILHKDPLCGIGMTCSPLIPIQYFNLEDDIYIIYMVFRLSLSKTLLGNRINTIQYSAAQHSSLYNNTSNYFDCNRMEYIVECIVESSETYQYLARTINTSVAS